MNGPEKRAGERLRVQEEALRFAQVALYRYRYDGTILEMNEAALDILGLRDRFGSPSEVLGRNIEDLIVYLGPKGRVRRMVKEQGMARNVLYPFKTTAGEERWALHDSFAVKDPETGEEVVQAIVKDVTEMKRAEEQLRESEERFRMAFENAAIGMALVGLDGHFLRVNRSLCQMTGYSAQELLSRDFQSLTHPDDLEKDLKCMRQLLAGEVATCEMEKRYLDKRSQTVWVFLTASLVRNAKGEPLYFVFQMVDITERRRLEALRDEFLSTAAHELKTPIATIKGYGQLIDRWLPEGCDPKVLQALAVVNRQCNRIARLVEALLEVSRLQRGAIELHPELFDLGQLAEEAVTELQPTAPRHRLVLKGRRRVMVNADRDRIAQVLFSLLDNAVKFSPKGGDVDVGLSVRDGEAVVSVRDRGVGIEKEKQASIFERFYRAHVRTPYDYSGLGIGLNLSRELVTRQGGRMWFQSTAGKGSTFYFSLPLAERAGDE